MTKITTLAVSIAMVVSSTLGQVDIGIGVLVHDIVLVADTVDLVDTVVLIDDTVVQADDIVVQAADMKADANSLTPSATIDFIRLALGAFPPFLKHFLVSFLRLRMDCLWVEFRLL